MLRRLDESPSQVQQVLARQLLRGDRQIAHHAERAKPLEHRLQNRTLSFDIQPNWNAREIERVDSNIDATEMGSASPAKRYGTRLPLLKSRLTKPTGTAGGGIASPGGREAPRRDDAGATLRPYQRRTMVPNRHGAGRRCSRS